MTDLPDHIQQRIEREATTIIQQYPGIDRGTLIASMAAIAQYAICNPYAAPKPPPASKPAKHVALPETQQETIIRLHQAGESIEAITAALNVTHTTIYNVLREACIKERRYAPWTEAEDYAIRNSDKLTITALAQALTGRTEAAIKRRRSDLKKRDEAKRRASGESVLS